MFVILAAVIVLSSIATVVTKSIVRAATYLLFVLLGTAGLYFLMGYTFLGSVQVMVYAGGIIVLYVFSILLTEGGKDEVFKRKAKDASWAFLLSLVGFITFISIFLTHGFKAERNGQRRNLYQLYRQQYALDGRERLPASLRGSQRFAPRLHRGRLAHCP